MSGLLAWGPATGVGTMRGRETPIVLRDRYRCAWADYSDLDSTAGHMRFRYLLFEYPAETNALPSPR